MNLLQLFSRHPASVGETYFEHCAAASRFALRLLGGGLRCLVHAFLPFLYVRAGSDCVAELHGKLTARRDLAEQSSNSNAGTNRASR
jgi:hypothetical protein